MASEGRVSPKIYLLASFVCISIVLGIFFRTYFVFASIPVLIYLGLLALQNGPIFELSVERVIEKGELVQGDSSKVRLRITNTGKNPIALATIVDSVPLDLKDGDSSFSFTLRAGESRDEYYRVRASTFGVFSLGPISAKCSDSSGMYSSEIAFENFSPLVVLPKTPEKLNHFKIRPRKTKPWPGEIVARKVGIGIDNYSIRQYIPGDSFRRINWRASAKLANEDLLLNEQTAELGADTIIIVDARPASDLIRGNESLINHSIRAAISVADKLLRDRNRVGLVTIGMDTERIPPGYGRRQYNRLVLSLIRVRSGGFFTFENIPSYLRYFYPHLAQVVLISPLVDSGAFSPAAEIAKTGYEILIISPNPVDFSAAKAGCRDKEKQRTLQISIDLALLARKANLDQLRKAGALIVDWRKDEPLDISLSKSMRAQESHSQLFRREM